MHQLEIGNLAVKIKNKTILHDFNLTIKSGEIHAIMGPNGAGKSTLSKVIMGDPNYRIIDGQINYDNQNINNFKVDERARLGLFLAMQSPIEIEGVSTADFLRTAVSSKEQDQFKLFPFIKEIDKTIAQLGMDKKMIERGINQGFSGGERKKNEILQMYLLKPDIVILDEIDSGLDVDSLKIVGENIMKYYYQYKCGIIVITHYKRLLEYIKPDFVHIMINGHIVKSGDYKLVNEIEQNGYEQFEKKVTKVSAAIIKENENDE